MSALKICPQCGTEYELDQRFCPKDGSTLRTQNAAGDLVGSIIADRYHVLKKLGEGGMGTVYLAEHVKMGRKSAVKVMNPGMVNDADAISRFNREAANASKISHPNVAAVYDFGETTDGLIYLAMEFIEGPSLTKIIEAGALPPQRAADIARQAADALAVAHDMGIVHRDLKPDNIMIAKNRDGSDLVKVVDFGIAKAANNEAQKVTKTGLVVGTPEYMSPEQLAGDKLDGRSDIYSLALVAFNMLTGKLPFPAETVQESMIMRLTDKPRPLSEMKSDVVWPPQLQTVMDKALERDANERYQSASEFGRAVWQAVQAVRASAATAAFTAVIQPRKAPATAPAPAAGGKTAPVPVTRVSKATPPAVLTQPSSGGARSRTPMFAGIAAVVVLLGGGGAYMAMARGADRTGGVARPQGDTSAPVAEAARPAPIDLVAAFETIEPLTDISRDANTQTASRALAMLDSLSSAAHADSDKVHIALLQAEAHFVRSENASIEADKASEKSQGCTILKDHEGQASRTRFKRRFDVFLHGDPASGLPKTC
ncbi:MAG TPA: serine/threonine-protein kinase [Gemmatimonadaceae bacterium]|nr:serine/threonine-protein kinase [Gemmatimonadaceae bacterium]